MDEFHCTKASSVPVIEKYTKLTNLIPYKSGLFLGVFGLFADENGLVAVSLQFLQLALQRDVLPFFRLNFLGLRFHRFVQAPIVGRQFRVVLRDEA